MISVLGRFGGGSEMMRDGCDEEGLLKVLDDGLKLTIIFDHLPWLAHFAKKISGVGDDINKMRSMGFQRAAVRQKSGSATKDLSIISIMTTELKRYLPPR